MMTAQLSPIPIAAGTRVNTYALAALWTAKAFHPDSDLEGWTPVLLHREGWFEFVNAQGLQVLISVNGRRLFHVPAA